MALPAVLAGLAFGLGRARALSFAAKGTRDRAPSPHLFRRPRCRPAHTNFCFGRDAGDRGRYACSFRGFGAPSATSRTAVSTGVYWVGCPTDGGIDAGKVGPPGPESGCPRGRAVSAKSCGLFADSGWTAECLCLL